MLKGLAKLCYVSHLLLWHSLEVSKSASYCFVEDGPNVSVTGNIKLLLHANANLSLCLYSFN